MLASSSLTRLTMYFNTFNDVQISCTCVSLPNFIGFANVVDCESTKYGTIAELVKQYIY